MSLIGVTSVPELLLAPRQIDRRFAMDVADLLVGQLQEFIGAGLEGRGGERLERVAQLILVGGAAARGEQPSGGKTGDQRQYRSNCKFQSSEFNRV